MKLNLKKASSRGRISSIVLFIIFLGLGIFFGYLNHLAKQTEKSAKQLYEEGAIYGAPGINRFEEPLAIRIYSIDIAFEEEEGDGDDLYIVEHDHGYAYMYTDENDLVFNNEISELESGPVTLLVGAYEWSEEDKVIIDEINADYAASGTPDIVVNRDTYLYYNANQFSADSSDRDFFTFAMCLFPAIGLVFLIVMIVGIVKNKNTYKKLIQQYPELENDHDIIPNAGYYDDKIRVAVYKNHVISVSNKFMAVDLREIKSYNTFIQNSYYSGIRTGQFYFINFIMKTNKSVKLPVRKYRNETEGRLDDVYSLISRTLNTIYNAASSAVQNPSSFNGYKPAQSSEGFDIDVSSEVHHVSDINRPAASVVPQSAESDSVFTNLENESIPSGLDLDGKGIDDRLPKDEINGEL